MQQLAAVIAPKLLGGEPARTPLGLLEARTMGEVWSLLDPELAWLDGDLLWNGRVAPPPVAG